MFCAGIKMNAAEVMEKKRENEKKGERFELHITFLVTFNVSFKNVIDPVVWCEKTWYFPSTVLSRPLLAGFSRCWKWNSTHNPA